MPSFRSPTSCHLQQSWIGLLAYHLLLLLLLVVNVEGAYEIVMAQGAITLNDVVVKIGTDLDKIVPEVYRRQDQTPEEVAVHKFKDPLLLYPKVETDGTWTSSLLVLRENAKNFNFRILPRTLVAFCIEREKHKAIPFSFSSTVWRFDDEDLNYEQATAFLLGLKIHEMSASPKIGLTWNLRHRLFDDINTKLSDNEDLLLYIEDNAVGFVNEGDQNPRTDFVGAVNVKIVNTTVKVKETMDNKDNDKKEGIEIMKLAACASRGSVFLLNWNQCEKVNDFLQTANIIIETDHGDIVVGFEKMLLAYVKGRDKVNKEWWFDSLMYIDSQEWYGTIIKGRQEKKLFRTTKALNTSPHVKVQFIDTDLEEFLEKRRTQKIALVSWSRYGPFRIEAEGVTYEAAVILEGSHKNFVSTTLTLMVFQAESIPVDYHIAAELMTQLYESWKPKEMVDFHKFVSFEPVLNDQQLLEMLLGMETYEHKKEKEQRNAWVLSTCGKQCAAQLKSVSVGNKYLLFH
eukprot:GHVS01038891.1.p1 GENE.GHVS01038891.1~~GHVS01038891.1.p1  ORF type:complete len:514 (+),score=46.43 GHVS01038891.1:114-1655(+)